MNVQSQIQLWKKQGEKVVLVTGIFDIIHIEHIRFLNNAKKAGDKLVVGIETDVRVKRIKGPNRPVNHQQIRLKQLNNLKPVDLAFLLPKAFNKQEEWVSFMKDLKPNVYAVSSHTNYIDNKKVICDQCDIDFQVVHQHNPGISTTKIFEKLKNDL